MKVRSYQDWKIWQLSDELFDMICDDYQKFPQNRLAWIIGDQVIRSIGSISANIAEGSGRGGNKGFVRFLIIARGSLVESQNWIYKIEKRKYINKKRMEEYQEKFKNLNKMINVLINRLRK